LDYLFKEEEKKEAEKESLLYLSTGLTLLNLACSDRVDGGFLAGKYHFIVGDSASGKTFLVLTCLAEASIDSRFDNYSFIYDGVEGGALMDIERFFGKKVKERLKFPSSGFSQTVEEFYVNLDKEFERGKPFIYILDSMDSLSSMAERERFIALREAIEKGRDISGSYGDNKAKVNSTNLRRVMGPLQETGSILIIVNQTRDIFSGNPFETKGRSGGHALRFYATLELWLSIGGKIDRVIRGKKRTLGILCKVKVKKNRVTGKEKTIVFPLYYSYGIDDIGSMVDWLIDENFWRKEKRDFFIPVGISIANGRSFRREDFIELVESDRDLYFELRDYVGKCWNELESVYLLKRKPKYG